VVPTRNAGRLLREALAAHAAQQDAAVWPPRVLTPTVVVMSCGPERARLASPLLQHLTWVSVLINEPLADYAALFPEPPAEPDYRWAAGLARSLQQVRSTLAEGGYDFQQLCAANGPHQEEHDRWADLARLEARYRARLVSSHHTDADDAKRTAAQAPELPDAVERIIIAAVPDPVGLLVHLLEKLPPHHAVPTDVLIQAPEHVAASFDRWGRPRLDVWLRAPIALPAERLHVRHSPAEQASTLLELARGHAEPWKTLGIGLLDAEVAPFLELAAPSSCALEFYDPQGLALSAHEVLQGLRSLATFLAERSFSALGILLRLPPAIKFFRQRANLRVTAAALLRDWDRFRSDHLPGSIEDACELATEPTSLRALLKEARSLLDDFSNLPLSESIPQWLQGCYGSRSFVSSSREGRDFLHAGRAIMEGLAEIEHAQGICALELSGAEQLSCLLESLAAARMELDRAPQAVDLQGWLELAWEPAPHLILAGFNQGRVPEHQLGDLFLPDAALAALGLRCNDTREARDAFLLSAMLASRNTDGQVDILLGKTDLLKEPLRPSRLLLRCPPAELAGRVRLLFDEDAAPPPAALPPPSTAWQLAPPPPPLPLPPLRVTDFKAYLECPLRFYFSRVLRMRPVEPAPTELDAAAFGSLCHHALRAFGQDVSLRESEDAAAIAEYLAEQVSKEGLARYGARPNIAVRLQLQSVERRLRAFANWQAISHAEGWRIVHAEVSLDNLLPAAAWDLGVELRGTIDRVDRRGNEWRVIDYKTSDRKKKPQGAHLAKAHADTMDRPWMLALGGTKRWTDLQLPLYALAVEKAHGTRPEIGYYVLPKAVNDAGYEGWEDFSDELAQSALACARGVITSIQAGDFRARVRHSPYDDAETILLRHPARAVAPAFVHESLSPAL